MLSLCLPFRDSNGVVLCILNAHVLCMCVYVCVCVCARVCVCCGQWRDVTRGEASERSMTFATISRIVSGQVLYRQ